MNFGRVLPNYLKYFFSLISFVRVFSLGVRVVQLFLISFFLTISEFAFFSVLYAVSSFASTVGNLEIFAAVEQRKNGRLYNVYDSLSLYMAFSAFLICYVVAFFLTESDKGLSLVLAMLAGSDIIVNERARRLNFQQSYLDASNVILIRNMLSFVGAVTVCFFYSDPNAETVLAAMMAMSGFYAFFLIRTGKESKILKIKFFFGLVKISLVYYVSTLALRSLLMLDKIYLDFDPVFLSLYSLSLTVVFGVMSVVDLVFFQIEYPKLIMLSRGGEMRHSKVIKRFVKFSFLIIICFLLISAGLAFAVGTINGYREVAGDAPLIIACLSAFLFYCSLSLYYVLYSLGERFWIFVGRVFAVGVFFLGMSLSLEEVFLPVYSFGLIFLVFSTVLFSRYTYIFR